MVGCCCMLVTFCLLLGVFAAGDSCVFRESLQVASSHSYSPLYKGVETFGSTNQDSQLYRLLASRSDIPRLFSYLLSGRTHTIDLLEALLPTGLRPLQRKRTLLCPNSSTAYFSLEIGLGQYHPPPRSGGSSWYDLKCANQNGVGVSATEYCEDSAYFVTLFEDILRNKFKFEFSHYLIQSPVASTRVFTRCQS
jgi:hypothetical protein